MKTLIVVLTLSAFILVSCQKDKLSKLYEKLPELPDNIANSLDTNLMTSKVASVYVAPVLDTGKVALAPCCSIRSVKKLKVTYPYTKCGPLRDFVVVNFDDLEASQGDRSYNESPAKGTATQARLQYYKFSKTTFGTILDKTICVTSNGPWDATLTENRACQNYAPHQTLVIAPYGNLIVFDWNGGVEGHPAQVGLVSCRQEATLEARCSPLSSCDCRSSICPATDPCDCGISDEW